METHLHILVCLLSCSPSACRCRWCSPSHVAVVVAVIVYFQCSNYDSTRWKHIFTSWCACSAVRQARMSLSLVFAKRMSLSLAVQTRVSCCPALLFAKRMSLSLVMQTRVSCRSPSVCVWQLRVLRQQQKETPFLRLGVHSVRQTCHAEMRCDTAPPCP